MSAFSYNSFIANLRDAFRFLHAQVLWSCLMRLKSPAYSFRFFFLPVFLRSRVLSVDDGQVFPRVYSSRTSPSVGKRQVLHTLYSSLFVLPDPAVNNNSKVSHHYSVTRHLPCKLTVIRSINHLNKKSVWEGRREGWRKERERASEIGG